MTCGHAKMLLHLNRPGELSEKERERLRVHLSTCVACRQEFDAVGHSGLERFFSRLDGVEDIPVERNLADIMAAIDDLRSSGKRSSTSTERFFQFLLSPRFRYASATAAVTCLLTLILQGVFLVRDLSHIEAQMTTARTAMPLSLLPPSVSTRSLFYQWIGKDPHLIPLATAELGLRAKPPVPTNR